MLHLLQKYKLYIVLFLAFIAIYVIYDNIYLHYDRPVAKITSVQENKIKQIKTNLKKSEIYYEQNIKSTILSGEKKGENIDLKNTYAASLVYDEKYKIGNKIFIEENHHMPGNWKISGIKRDSNMLFSFLLLFFFLIAIGKKQGLATILCLLANIGILTSLLLLHTLDIPLLPLAIGASILFSLIIIFLINGINVKSLLVVFVTLAGIASITLLSALTIYTGSPLEYEFLEYLSEPFEHSEANFIFLSEILMASTGVIIDIAVTIVSFSTELIAKKPGISAKSLIKSCFVVSENITGTMINVVFFTNVAGSIPLFVISLTNGVSLLTLLRYNIYFEACRFFTGGIGILLTIPFSAIVAIIYSKRRYKKC